jgi:hypothetical protein
VKQIHIPGIHLSLGEKMRTVARYDDPKERWKMAMEDTGF